MVRSAIRPFRDVPQVMQRSQNSLAVAPQTGHRDDPGLVGAVVPQPDQAVADHARESDMAEVVRRALDRLPQRMRTAVMLGYFEDMTEPEIAASLGISLGTVKSAVSRAVAKLRIDAELGEDSGA